MFGFVPHGGGNGPHGGGHPHGHDHGHGHGHFPHGGGFFPDFEYDQGPDVYAVTQAAPCEDLGPLARQLAADWKKLGVDTVGWGPTAAGCALIAYAADPAATKPKLPASVQGYPVLTAGLKGLMQASGGLSVQQLGQTDPALPASPDIQMTTGEEIVVYGGLALMAALAIGGLIFKFWAVDKAADTASKFAPLRGVRYTRRYGRKR